MLGVSEIKVQFANHLIYAQTCMCLDTDLCNSERSKLTAECSVLSFMLLQKPLLSKTNVFAWNSRSLFPSVCVWKVLTEGQRPLPRTKAPLSRLPHTLVSDLCSSPWGRPRKLLAKMLAGGLVGSADQCVKIYNSISYIKIAFWILASQVQRIHYYRLIFTDYDPNIRFTEDPGLMAGGGGGGWLVMETVLKRAVQSLCLLNLGLSGREINQETEV